MWYCEPKKGRNFRRFSHDLCKLILRPGPTLFGPCAAPFLVLFSFFQCQTPTAAGISCWASVVTAGGSVSAHRLIPYLFGRLGPHPTHFVLGPFALFQFCVRLLPTFDRYSGPFPSFYLLIAASSYLLIVLTFIVYVFVCVLKYIML